MSTTKKHLIIFLSMFIIFNFDSSAHANSTSIIFENNLTQVKTTPLMINKQMVYTTFPSFIYKGRTYVPIRFITDLLGAESIWNEEDSSLLIKNANDSLILFANHNFASLNGEMIMLDDSSKPVIVSFPGNKYGHTSIPLVFIANFLNCDIGYDTIKKVPYINSPCIDLNTNKLTNEIKTIKIVEDHLFLEGVGNGDFKIIYLSNPDRIVIDMKNSILKGRNKFDLNKNLLYIKNIRGGQFTPDTVRIVLDLKINSNLFYLDIVPTGNNLEIYPKIR